MIPSLEIRNYRLFKHLTIETLGWVNLITGKNNAGKTAFLEALQLYSSKFSIDDIVTILTRRDELTGNLIKSFFSLCYNHYNAPISIGHYHDENNTLSARFRQVINPGADGSADAGNGLEITFNNIKDIIPLDNEHQAHENKKSPKSLIESKYKEKCIFVYPFNLFTHVNSYLWDNISLSPLENELTDGLHLIFPEIKDIALRGHNVRNSEREFIVKLDKFDYPVPITSLGKGYNRILGIIFSLVNSHKGMLLVDEIENGIHHTIQPKLWKLMLELAERLEIQVIVTTHSKDVVNGFQHALSEFHAPELGQLIRLENVEGDISSTIFSGEELIIAARNDIEVR